MYFSDIVFEFWLYLKGILVALRNARECDSLEVGSEYTSFVGMDMISYSCTFIKEERIFEKWLNEYTIGGLFVTVLYMYCIFNYTSCHITCIQQIVSILEKML